MTIKPNSRCMSALLAASGLLLLSQAIKADQPTQPLGVRFRLSAEQALHPYGGIPFCADLNADGKTDVLWLQTAGWISSSMHDGKLPKGRYSREERSHYCLTATDASGKILWQMGTPWSGKRPFVTHGAERMIACADIDGDDGMEVVCIRLGELLVLDGRSGAVEKSVKIPMDNAGCVVPAHTGPGRADWTIMVKPCGAAFPPHEHGNPAWFYDSTLKLLKTADYRGSGHCPQALDIDGDGLDEFLIGLSLVDNDLQTLWSFDLVPPEKWNPGPDDHVDDHAVGRVGGRTCVACAVSDTPILLDAKDGSLIWKHKSVHPQHCQVGRFTGKGDTDDVFFHNKRSYLQLFDAQGKELWRIDPPQHFPLGQAAPCKRAKFHVFDPTTVLRGVGPGGTDLLVFSDAGWPYVIDGRGQSWMLIPYTANAAQDWGEVPGHRPDDYGYGYYARAADFDGDGREELLINDRRFAWFYEIENCCAADQAAVLLSDCGKAKATIVLGETATAPERFAAEELARYLEQIGGAELPIATDAAGPAILLGTPESNGKLDAFKGRLQGLPADAFLIKTAGGNLILAANSGRGVLYAVYTLLEEYLGVGWAQFKVDAAAPDEIVPHKDIVSIPTIDRLWRPAFKYRSQQLSCKRAVIPHIDWIAKNKMNVVLLTGFPIAQDYTKDSEYAKTLLPEIERRGLGIELTHHDMKKWLWTSDELFAEHPEYFALVDGKRAQHIHQFSFCLSHPQVAELMAGNIKTFLRNHPEVDILDLWPEDGYGGCQCPKCKQLGSKPGKRDENTDYYLRFLNDVASRVKQEFPHVPICYLAYVNVTQAPVKIQPRDNVLIYYANYVRCFDHALGNPRCGTNKFYYRGLNGWLKYDNEVVIYEYFHGMGGYCELPYPVLNVMVADMRDYAKLGVAGMATVSMTRPACHLQGYAVSRLAWNTKLSVDEILAEYCRRYFAESAEPMKKYYKRWEQAMADLASEQFHYKPILSNIVRLANDQTLEDVDCCLQQAEARAESKDVKERIAEVRRLGYEYPRRVRQLLEKRAAAKVGKEQGNAEQLEKDKEEMLRMRAALIKRGFGGRITEKAFSQMMDSLK